MATDVCSTPLGPFKGECWSKAVEDFGQFWDAVVHGKAPVADVSEDLKRAAGGNTKLLKQAQRQSDDEQAKLKREADKAADAANEWFGWGDGNGPLHIGWGWWVLLGLILFGIFVTLNSTNAVTLVREVRR